MSNTEQAVESCKYRGTYVSMTHLEACADKRAHGYFQRPHKDRCTSRTRDRHAHAQASAATGIHPVNISRVLTLRLGTTLCWCLSCIGCDHASVSIMHQLQSCIGCNHASVPVMHRLQSYIAIGSSHGSVAIIHWFQSFQVSPHSPSAHKSHCRDATTT